MAVKTRSMRSRNNHNCGARCRQAYSIQSKKAGCMRLGPRRCATSSQCKMSKKGKKRFCRTKRNKRYL